MTIKVLIAEDAATVADVVAFGARMTWPGCDVTTVDNGADAIAHAAAHSPDLVVLDVSLPPPDGFEVCRWIRDVSQVPILMLTVRDATIDKVRAFDLGADDYLTKPFDHLELLARMRALVRRSLGPNGHAGGGFVHGDLSIDFYRREVHVGEDAIHLTSTEYRILEELARNAGSTMPHHLLLERVWGPELVGDPSYLKVFVRRLRQKLGDDAGDPRYIETVWGIGYRLLAPQGTLVSS